MRRALVVIASVVAVLATLIVGGGRLSAQDGDLADHPIVGPWELAADVGDGDTSCLSQVIFTDEGGYVDVDCDGAVVIGAWAPTSDATVTLMITVHDTDEGSYRIRAEVEVAADGQSFTGTFTFELLDLATGEGMGEYGPGTVTGTRAVAEGPGTPVGTVMDLFAMFGEGTPEATPAP